MLAWILLGVSVLLVALGAIYVAAEFSLVTVDRAAVARAVDAGAPGAPAVQKAIRSLSTELSGAQIGITFTTLALGYAMEPSLAALLAGPLGDTGLSAATATSLAVALSLLVATVVSMVFGELVPKNIALAEPLATARLVAPPLRFTTWLSTPLIWALNGTANGVLRLVGVAPQEELRSARSAQELTSLVQRSGLHGTLERRIATLLSQSISFSDKSADDVLTPRVDVVTVSADDPVSEVVRVAAASGLSRFPVIGTDIDDVVGLVHLKRALVIPREQRADRAIADIMSPAPVVPGTVPLDDLLAVLKRRGLQMAVVVDEYGGTAGIVTLEDVVEELVGEIADEHDQLASIPEPQPDGTWIFPAHLRADEVDAFTGVRLPEPEKYDTVAGLITERLERLPQPGDSVVVPAALAAHRELGALGDDEAIPADPSDDLPRVVAVRLTAAQLEGHRLITVQLSAVGMQQERHPEQQSGEESPDHPAEGSGRAQ